MSCIHIQGTQREGVDVPLVFRSPPVTARTIKRLWANGTSNNPQVRAAAASNFHAPSGLLSRLAMDSSEVVRTAVARNPTCPTHVLQVLSQDSSMVVRAHVAYNRNTPDNLLLKLKEDEEERVSNIADFILNSD